MKLEIKDCVYYKIETVWMAGDGVRITVT